MSSIMANQVLSFESFAALENHLRAIKNKYTDMIKKYEETLGYILRDTKPTSLKTQQVQHQWAVEMQRSLTAKSAATRDTKMVKKEDGKPKLFGNGNGKDKQNEKSENGEWIILDPMSLFIGPKNQGLAEIYFDTINVLRENIAKINSALSVCIALKAKATSTGTTSLIVSFINDIPTKVQIQSSKDNKKKYTMAYSFAVPSMPSGARSLPLK
ncbi:MAG: hypothetical protein E6K92_09895 [Thaumarchaeota archaeon]|nr:MAG: hypothetical protein E6K92_09895 [Nitrososphaerota archaeon]